MQSGYLNQVHLRKLCTAEAKEALHWSSHFHWIFNLVAFIDGKIKKKKLQSSQIRANIRLIRDYWHLQTQSSYVVLYLWCLFCDIYFHDLKKYEHIWPTAKPAGRPRCSCNRQKGTFCQIVLRYHLAVVWPRHFRTNVLFFLGHTIVKWYLGSLFPRSYDSQMGPYPCNACRFIFWIFWLLPFTKWKW